jgi:hypothetical protein
MGRACSTYGRDECMQYFALENLKGRNHLEDLGIGGKIILGWILGKQVGKMWIGFIGFRIRINDVLL